MNIPLLVILIPYLAVLLVVAIRMAANIYVVFRFAYLHRASLMVVMVILLAMAGVLSLTAGALTDVSWTSSVRVTLPSYLVHPSSDSLP